MKNMIKDKPQSTTKPIQASKQSKGTNTPDSTQYLKCPFCGNKEYYIKQRMSGTCEYNKRFDGAEASDNSEMHEGLRYTTISKYAYCNNCFKRLFKLDTEGGNINGSTKHYKG